MNDPLFLNPVFQERIWGGTELKTRFHYNLPSDRIGECWGISGHPNGPSIVQNGPFAGKTLLELWKERRELFGGMDGDVFPLLTKILDAKTNLSVQVHPHDDYARKHENGELGKTECWYILDCKEGAEMIYGHTAQSKEEFKKRIERGEWSNLLRRVPIKPGDFFYVPSGTVHALCEGTIVLETQQCSDTTYRVYDYDRTDQNGQKRELHIEKSLDVITVPHTDAPVTYETKNHSDAVITTFMQSDCFSVYKWDVSGSYKAAQDKPFMLASVVEGDGFLKTNKNAFPIRKGDHFILPSGLDTCMLDGSLSLIVSHP